MRASILFFILTFLKVATVYSQNSFIKQYGGVNLNDHGCGWDVLQAFDGNYVVSGVNYSGADEYLQLFKTDTSGNLIWGKEIKPTSNSYSIGSWCPMLQSADSGFFLTGKAYSTNSGYYNIYYLKTDKDGNLSWAKLLSVPMLHIYGDNAIQTSDGGYLIIGSYYDEPPPNTGTFLIKTDAVGNLLWAKVYSYAQFTGYMCVVENEDSTYTLIGQDGGIKNVQLDINGNVLSIRHISLSWPTSALCIKTPDDGFLVVGKIDIQGQPTDLFVMKIDSTDSVSWCNKISSQFEDRIFSPNCTNDGGFIFTVYSSTGAINVSYIFRLNSSGDTLWTKGFDEAALYSVMQDHSGNYVATGRMDDIQPVQTTMIKIDSSGSSICPLAGNIYQISPLNYQYQNPSLFYNTASFNSFNIPLTVSNFSNQNDYCAPLSTPDNKEYVENVYGRFYDNVLELTYESFNASQIQIILFDINGRRIFSKETLCQQGSNKYTIETTLVSSIYFVKILSDNKEVSIKLVKTF